MTPDPSTGSGQAPGRVPAALVAGDAARLIELVRAQHHTSDTASGGFVCFGCTRTGWAVPFPCIYARLADALESSQRDLRMANAECAFLQVAAGRVPAARMVAGLVAEARRHLDMAGPFSDPISQRLIARLVIALETVSLRASAPGREEEDVVQAAIAWRAAYRAVADATSREYPGDTEDAAPRWVEGMTRASVEYSTAEDALGAAVDALLTVRDGRGG